MRAPSEMPRLFISHSHEDDAFCQRLIADLRTRLGDDDAVWYDSSGGLHGSDDWWDRIIAEITARPYFLVVLSPSASTSRWVPQEMKIAFRQHVELGKRLLPVRLAAAPRRPDWESLQEFDFTASDDPARYAAALADVLRALGLDPTTSTTSTAHVTSALPMSVSAADQPAPSLPQPAARPLTAMERLAQEAHTAYGREHWSDVLDKTELLSERGAMTATLWRERASAAFALDDTRAGLAAVEKALTADPDDADTLLLRARLFVKAGDDAQAVTTFTRAYALAPLDASATRLLILDALTAALARLGRWDDYTRRVTDACRMAPDDPRWLLRSIEGLLGAQRYTEALATLQTLPATINPAPLLHAWEGAVNTAWLNQNWPARHVLLDAAASTAGADPATITHWRRVDFPRFALLTTLSGHTEHVLSVAWAPDGARLATASDDKTTRIWGEEQRAPAPPGPLTPLPGCAVPCAKCHGG